MRYILKLTLAAVVLFSTCTAWAAPDRGNAEDAVAMVKKVIDDMKKNGKDKVVQDVQGQNPRYKDRDLYVFISTINGMTLANGANPRMVGKDLSEIKDIDGRPMGKERFEMARTKGKGWQDYRWPDPITKEIKKKSVYLERFDDLVISCGIYKD